MSTFLNSLFVLLLLLKLQLSTCNVAIGKSTIEVFSSNASTNNSNSRDCQFNKTGISGTIIYQNVFSVFENVSLLENLTIDCLWNITVKPGYKIYINFNDYNRHFQLEPQGDCNVNYIDVYESKDETNRSHRLCQAQTELVKEFGRTVLIRFVSTLNSVPKFKITYNAFREIEIYEKCLPYEFACDNSTCIDASLKCDGVENCKNGVDEDKQNICEMKNHGKFNLHSTYVQLTILIILVVLCALILGLCITTSISCWIKIQERRNRKRQFKATFNKSTTNQLEVLPEC